MSASDWISTILSGTAIVISVYSLYIARRYQTFDYEPRLQILDELIQSSRIIGKTTYTSLMGQEPLADDINVETLQRKSPSAFGYSARLVNMSDKPLQINKILMKYGDRIDQKRQVNYVIDGQSYLRSGDDRGLVFEIDQDEMAQFQQRFEIDECFFTLRVQYFTASGKIVEATRELGSPKTMIAQRGVTLTPKGMEARRWFWRNKR